MSKFKITWYEGSVGKIDKELKSKVVEAEDIRKVNYITIVPKKERLDKYFRVILYSNKKNVVDYGSWTKFIEVKEIE